MNYRKLLQLAPISVFLMSMVAAPSQAALTAYLKIGDIKGESQRVDHEDEIDIYGFYWESSTESSSGNSRRTRSRCDIKDLEVLKYVDAASPPLIMSQLTGRVFDEAVLSVRKDSGEASLDYLVITLYNVTITSVRAIGGEDSDSQLISERVALGFESGIYSYTRQSDDHSAGETVEASFNDC